MQSKKINRYGIIAAIMTISFIQMASNAPSPAVADMAKAFPETSDAGIQYIMTMPNLMVVLLSSITAIMSMKVSKKLLASMGMSLAILSGILAYLNHQSVRSLYVCQAMLGIGIGLAIPIANSLITDYFEGKEKDTLLGWQTSAANIGSMLMTFLAGILVSYGWYNIFLVYLLAVPGLLLTLLFVPRDNARSAKNQLLSTSSQTAGTDVLTEKKVEKRVGIPSGCIKYILVAPIFMLLFYMGPTNLAMLIEEKGIGSPMFSGITMTVLLFGGTIMGLLFGKLSEKISTYTIPLGFISLAVGFLVLYSTRSIIQTLIGALLVGMSNTMVLPQCMGQMATGNNRQTTFLLSVVLSMANLGTFLAPVLTTASAIITKRSLVSSRILFTAIFALIGSIVTAILVTRSRNKVCVH